MPLLGFIYGKAGDQYEVVLGVGRAGGLKILETLAFCIVLIGLFDSESSVGGLWPGIGLGPARSRILSCGILTSSVEMSKSYPSGREQSLILCVRGLEDELPGVPVRRPGRNR